MSKKPTNPNVINRRARYDYELGDDLIVGLVLSGPETRAARDGHVQLKGAYVSIQSGELWLNNASFSLRHNQKGGGRSIDSSPRKLLAHRQQIDSLAIQKKQGMTIVPTKLLNQGNKIKLVIALGKGKKRWDKRQAIKQRDQDRETRRQI